MDPARLGLWVAALTPIAGAAAWVLRQVLVTWRASIAARQAAEALQRADRERMVCALLEAARADAELRISIDAALDEVRAAAAWHQGTVYRPRSEG